MGPKRLSRVIAIAFCALYVTATAAIRADTTTPTSDSVFRSRGLVQNGKWLVLYAESDLHQRVWTLRQSDEAVRGATSTHRSLRPEVMHDEQLAESFADQREALEKRCDAWKGKTDDQSIDNLNITIAQADAFWSKLINEEETIDGLVEREGQVEEARARFLGGVMDMQAKAEALAKQYSRLSKDAALAAAIAQANGDADPPLVALGPSPAFSDDLEFLRDASQKIVSAWVVVTKTQSIGGLHVQPILNGEHPMSMVWDSGCSLTVLNAATAAAAGVKITDQNPAIEATIANGAKLKGKSAVIDSVQLGPFTLHNVECQVMEGEDAPNLLGNSFQSHFLSRLDQDGGRLQLTPIDSSVDIAATAAPVVATAQGGSTSSENRASARPADADLAREATATASSTEDGSSPHGAIDGIVAGAPQSPRCEWACNDTTGSITLTWDQPVTVGLLKLWDRVDGTDHVVSGQLVFDDGSTVPFGELPTDGTPLSMRFPEHTTRSIRFEILSVGAGTEHPGFAEISLFK
jgi:clan AA aspartic protease (TIGR02281 family)